MSASGIDWPRFASDLRATRARAKIGVRQAAEQIGISHATLSRAENEKPTSADGFALICAWMRADMGHYSPHPPGGDHAR